MGIDAMEAEERIPIVKPDHNVRLFPAILRRAGSSAGEGNPDLS